MSSRSTVPVLPLLGWAVLVVLATGLSAYALSYPLNHDVAWYLYVAGQMLDGEDLYLSFIEINPPLSTYLSVGPAALSSMFSRSIEPIAKGIVLLVSLLVVGWATLLVVRRASSPALPIVFAAALLASFLGLPGIDFGQREHLLMLFTTPYMIVLWRRSLRFETPRYVAVASGILAGLGIAFKPHFLVIWLALEAWCYPRTRSGRSWTALRPESVSAAATGVVYLAIVFAFHREYLDLVWNARDLYGRFNAQSRLDLLGSAYVVPLLAGLYLVRGRTSRTAGLAGMYVVFGCAAFLVMVVQGKGWSYHILPVLGGTVTFGTLLGLDEVRSWRWSVRPAALGRLVALGVLVAGTVVAVGSMVDRHLNERERRISELSARASYFDGAAPGAGVLLLTHRVEEGFPLVTRAELEWGSAFSHLWWIKALYEDPAGRKLEVRPPEEMGDLERRYVDALIDRMRVVEPAYVLVDTVARDYYGDRAFPYVRYLEQMPDFAEEWRSYERVGSLDGFTVWRRGERPVSKRSPNGLPTSGRTVR